MRVLPQLCVLLALIGACTFGEDEPPTDVVKQTISEDEFARITMTSAEMRTLLDSRRDTLCQVEIRAVSKFAPLSEQQVEKLRLAAKADLMKTLGDVARTKEKYVGTALSEEDYRRAKTEMNRLRTRIYPALRDADSFFQKTLAKIMREDQADGYAKYRDDVHLTQLEHVWKSWETHRPNTMVLPRETRDRLNQLLMKETSPLPGGGQYSMYIVLLQMSEREARVQPLMKADEWDAFTKAVNEARVMENSVLRNLKLWPILEKELD